MFFAQDMTENINLLDIYNVTHQVVYSVPVGTINAGDVLQITSEFEATNPYSYNVMIGSWVILASSPTDVTGTLIDPANAYNITPANHHGVVTKARNWQAPSSYTGKYVNVVAWASSVNAMPGQMLTIEQSYGHLDVYINN